ncbi:unnamed protein product [Schistosoma rodhaini]|nr:unnamed protein product [Schistosoma rodhaini]
MTLAFNDVSTVTNQNNYICIYQNFKDPIFLSGLIVTFIGLIIGFMVAFIGKLHSSSIMNIIFMVITMIFMIVGVSLIMSFAKCYVDQCKRTRFKKKMEDIIVHNVLCIYSSWIHSLCNRGDIENECFARSGLDLFVLHNVYCHYIHSSISANIIRSKTVFFTLQYYPGGL